jgi:hypothetical protein
MQGRLIVEHQLGELELALGSGLQKIISVLFPREGWRQWRSVQYTRFRRGFGPFPGRFKANRQKLRLFAAKSVFAKRCF